MIKLIIIILLLAFGCAKKVEPPAVPIIETKVSEPIRQVSKSFQVPKSETIYFDFDDSKLKESEIYKLRAFADNLVNFQLEIIVEGHCDNRGTNQYNLSLGQKRAESVKDYLLGYGVKNIETISYGEEKPVCHDDSDDCWDLNRRAIIIIKE